MEPNDSTPRDPGQKPAWTRPRLRDLGNLRQFVQNAGHPPGKSFPNSDGGSSETMEMPTRP
jgi:hypothetical protein